MLKIALGTASNFKIKTVKEIAKEIGIKVDLIPVSVDSSVSDQPLKLVETKKGSVNRAKEALKEAKGSEVGLGIEVGYEKIRGKYFIHAWASIADRHGNIYSEQSSTLELSKHFQKIIKSNDYVGHHVEDYSKKHKRKEWRYFAETFRSREPFLKESVRNVLLRYCFRDEY